jgi:carbon-monoxide dehydrogenase medium subunit
MGSVINDSTIEMASEVGMESARPISDVRSSANYRRQMVKVLTSRALHQAFARGGS